MQKIVKPGLSHKKILIALAIPALMVAMTSTGYAAMTAGGGLPFDNWITSVRNSVTGPFAFGVAIIGMVGTGAGLIFGGELNGFLKSMLFIVLVMALIIASSNMMTFFGSGAVIG